MSKIENGEYISSNGNRTPIAELPYPYLVNAMNKALQNGDLDTHAILNKEVASRPAQE